MGCAGTTGFFTKKMVVYCLFHFHVLCARWFWSFGVKIFACRYTGIQRWGVSCWFYIMSSNLIRISAYQVMTK